MPKSNLDTAGNNFAVKSDNILASEDKLKITLNSVYEAARKNSTKFHITSCYSVLFSISFTLLVTLFTSNFKAIGSVTAESVTVIAWVAFLACLVLGIICLVLFYRGTHSNWEEERDKTVNSKIEQLKPKTTV